MDMNQIPMRSSGIGVTYDKPSYDGRTYSLASQLRERKQAIIPQEPDTCNFLYDVDCETKRDVEVWFGSLINYDWHCNTIANCTVEAIIKALNVDMAQSGARSAWFNFYDMFFIKVTNKINEKAEKEGNINVAFEPGPTAIKLIDTNVSKVDEVIERMDCAKFFLIENPDEDPEVLTAQNEKYSAIDRQARYVLSNNYAITIPESNKYMAFGVTYLFIRNIFRKLLAEIAEHPEMSLVSVNFNDNIEFHAARSEDDESKIILAMRPGLNAKLLIKSDEMTEDDEIDEDFFML